VPDSEAELELITDTVLAYQDGELPFEEALAKLAATSLTWQQAQILLADDDGSE